MPLKLSLRDRILAATTSDEVIRLSQEGQSDEYRMASPGTKRKWAKAVKASLARISLASQDERAARERA